MIIIKKNSMYFLGLVMDIEGSIFNSTYIKYILIK